MRIALISPAGAMYRKGCGIFPRALRYAPLTLTTLAALVPEELNADITLYDEGAAAIPSDIDADLIGITAITGTANRAYAIADHYRQSGVTVVLGGVHPTLMPDEAAQHADAVVSGLAFKTWPALLRDFAADRMRERYVGTSDDEVVGIPMPRRDLLSRFAYISRNSVQATYGCPYRCDFCAVVATQKQYLHRPIPEVIAELEAMSGPFFVFVDPSPTEDREYIKALWTAMIPLKKKWGALATVKLAEDIELMDLAAESGCTGLLLGFETVSQDGVNTINKGFNKVRHYKNVVKELHDRSIGINGTFMFGMDTDDADCFARTVDFVMETSIDLPRYALYTPFPGTPVFDRLEREGRILTRNWSRYDGQHVVFQPARLEPEELLEGHLWAWEQTYSAKSILSRSLGSGCAPLISAVTNFGYRKYAVGLRPFPDYLLENDAQVWQESDALGMRPLPAAGAGSAAPSIKGTFEL